MAAICTCGRVALSTHVWRTDFNVLLPSWSRGLGEILVYLNLATCFGERAVYAIRALEFNPEEKTFRSPII